MSMAFFKAKKDPALAELSAFCGDHSGVEGYLEPPAGLSKLTLLLVDDEGEFIRRQVPSIKWARNFCTQQRIPCYDPRRVGYPERMRVGKTNKAKESTKRPQAELAAIMTLESIAKSGPLDDSPTNEQLQSLLKAARINAHPDRNNGDRNNWDRVEQAAKQLGLI